MSTLKLTADSGGGTVAIKAPASTTSNSAFELTLPGTGNRGLGKILQVVSNFKDDLFTTTATSYTDVTGLNVTITPSSNSSKILIVTCCSQHGNNVNTVFSMQLVRGSTNIAVSGDSGSDPIASSMTTHYGAELTSAYNWSYHFLDSPSTTSAVTYKWQVKVNAGTGAINGRSGSSGALGGTSSMTAMEVAA